MLKCKTFSVTKQRDRDELGGRVTEWLRSQPPKEVIEKQVLQSSDNEFHCFTIVIWYN